MAIIWMDGPDHYGANSLLLTQGPYASGVSLAANQGPGGVGNVFLSVDAALRKVLPGGRDLVGMGYRMFFANLPGTFTRLMEFRDNGNSALARVTLLSTGAIRIELVDTVAGQSVFRTLIETGPVIVASSWQHIEVRLSFASAMISCELGIDSITVATIDNFALNVAFPQCAQVAPMVNSQSTQWRMRDLYIWDDTGDLNNSGMQGDRQVITVYPTADGTFADWTPSSGAFGWSLINEAPPVDAGFISSNAPDQESSFQMGDVDVDITSISAAMVVARIKKSDAGLATFKLGVISDGEEAETIEKAASTEWVYYNGIFETDPNTDVKWSPFGINSVQTKVTRSE